MCGRCSKVFSVDFYTDHERFARERRFWVTSSELDEELRKQFDELVTEEDE